MAEVRLIDADGQNIGIVSLSEALRLAQEDDLDVIEIGPTGQPPVARIGDFGQFKYELNKKERKQKIGQKKTETKGIRVSLRISKHDLEFKARQAQKFIGEGHRVQLEMFLRGRERAHYGLAKEVIEGLAAMVPESKLEQPAKQLGNKIIVIISPKNK